jgi:plastocyanin
LLNSVLSKATFGIGIALAVAAIATIYVSSVASQRQASNSSSQQTSSVASSTTNNIANNRTNNTNNGGASQLTTQISIPQGAATKQVKIFYQPNPASVLGGAKITWTNKDSAPHTATAAADNSFDTGIIQPGSSGSDIIKGRATIPYHCTIHPWMTASLMVASSDGNGG